MSESKLQLYRIVQTHKLTRQLAQHIRMSVRHAQQCLRGTRRLASALLSLLQGAYGNAHEDCELALGQT